jgi:hypothetical protein
MTTHYPKNFGAMLHAFMFNWKPGAETVDFQHMDRRVDPITGRQKTMHGEWQPCWSLTELIGKAQSWPITDNYISVQRFTAWSKMEGSVRSDHSAYVLDRIYTDTDPEAGEGDCLHLLPRYRRMQEALSVDGKTAVWLICSGRGFHTYTYLDRPITVAEGRELQNILGYVFDLELDYHVPITRARMMRLPYSKNSRTNTWVLSVGQNMSLRGLRNAMKSELLDGCHWENPARVTPEKIWNLHPGTKILDEYQEQKRAKARAALAKKRESFAVKQSDSVV